MTKRCSRCGDEKPLDAFNQKQNRCKACQSAYKREHYLAHREAICAKSRAWYARNPERGRQRAREWAERNPERYRALKAADAARLKAERAEARRKWEIENREKLALLKLVREKRKREESVRRGREWRQNNPEKRKAQKMRHRGISKAAAGASYTTAEMVAARVAMFGGRCRYCGEAGTEIDHRIPLSRGGSHWPANLVPACRTCNATKNAKTEREFIAA